MKKDTIVQFICFASKLDKEEFIPLWSEFAKKYKNPSGEINLFEVSQEKKSRFRYVCRITGSASDFRFAFMKGRNSEHFPEQAARVIQLGGYAPLQMQATKAARKEVKLLAFMDPNHVDLEFCKQQSFTSLNIYEAYFENCTYSYIMEYYVPEKDASSLVEQLSAHGGIQVMTYMNTAVSAVG